MDVDEDIFAGFDLDEIRALEEGDLSLFSNLIDPGFRLRPNGTSGSDSNPSPTSITPSSAEELALALQLDEDDPKLMSSNFLAFKSPNGPTSANNGAHYLSSSNDQNFLFPNNNNSANNNNQNEKRQENESKPSSATDEIPAPPPLVVCPIEVGKASITLQKNQLCACKECGKLFKSIWYLKQHAVRHSNERPFKCNFCQKAFKFRSNLYQHNCPERLKRGPNIPLRNLQGNGAGINPVTKKRFYTRGIAYTEQYGNNSQQSQQQSSLVNSEELNQFQKLLYSSGQQQQAPTGPQQMSNIFGANGSGQIHAQGIDPNFQGYGQPPLNFEIKMEMDSQQMNPGFGYQQSLVDANSVRNKPLDPEFIDSYLEKNRHRIYSCRKCKINFPYREYLQRHMAYHSDLDTRSYGCDQCPQRFTTEKQLESHLQKHVDDSPHRCYQCNGAFRSALALRRHKDQCRSCYCPPFGDFYQQQQIISPNAAPLDQYAFIDSDLEEEDPLKNLGLNRQKSTGDSGMGSDSSTHSYTTSPIGNRHGIEEELDMNAHRPSHPHPPQINRYPTTNGGIHQNSKSPNEKSGKDDETDSGFRSRLNSTAQSCSPGSSSFSSESGESPSRKFSKTGHHHPHEHQTHGMPGGYSNNSQFNQPQSGSTSNAGTYPSNGGYNQRDSRSHQHMPRNSTHYEGAPRNNWSLSEEFERSGNNYRQYFEINSSSESSVCLMTGPIDFSSSFLSGKRMLNLVDRFEMEELEESVPAVEEDSGLPYSDQWPFEDSLEVADPRQVVEEAIRLFIRRFLAVFLDAVLDAARHSHRTNKAPKQPLI